MAGALMSFGIQKLLNVLSHEHELFHGVKGQVTDLQTDLRNLKSFLVDADAKKNTNASVKTCMKVIEEIIFDAENIIETFVLKDELGKNGGVKKRIERFARIIPERRKIASEIRSLRERISKVNDEMVTYGVRQNIADVKDPQPSQQRLEFACKKESNLVGLEENVTKLVRCLVEKDDVQVVSMTGMGGLGKTTLARQVFNHETVTKKFDRLAWVCVTQICDRKKVWQAILQNFRPNEENKISEMTEATLQDELFRLLATSKFLIVFDDVWNEKDWELIKPIFPHKTGSKVLITSRNENIARRAEKYINFKPKGLSDQDSWTLFQTICQEKMPRKDASEFNKVDKEMEEIGKQMIKYCGGLPLAVNVLGGLLAKKCTLHDWRRLSENIGSHLVERKIFNDGNNKSVYNVLSLSFEELPSSLKYCFLYLAHFPEDHEISVEDLSYLWAAEGILKFNDVETIRDAGDSYIEKLVERYMVISERDNTTWRFETCHLHDMMREICLSEAKEENFLQIAGISSPTSHSQSHSTSRRFVSQNPAKLDVKREVKNLKVRSLVVVGKDTLFINVVSKADWKLSSLNFTRLQLLRVLHLAGAKFKGYKLPYSIGKLIHLRYLSLEDARVSHLPSSLRNLKLLIYLNLKVVFFIPMHNFLREMKELKYLALPSHKKKKLKLSHLVNLETLVNFSTENGSLEDLHGMARLRTLGINLSGETSLEALYASIGGLKHLENLDIDYRGAKVTKKWRTLFESNNLIQLNLRIHIPLLSDQLQFPSCLTSLSLTKSHLEEDPMPILEKFVQLKEVNLRSGSFRGRKMVCSDGGFPQLQILSFCSLDEWGEWIIEEGSMPLLHTLEILFCNNLKELPDGLRFISSLKNLSVMARRDDEWKKRLSEGGEDYHKVQHIPFVRIYGCYLERELAN